MHSEREAPRSNTRELSPTSDSNASASRRASLSSYSPQAKLGCARRGTTWRCRTLQDERNLHQAPRTWEKPSTRDMINAGPDARGDARGSALPSAEEGSRLWLLLTLRGPRSLPARLALLSAHLCRGSACSLSPPTGLWLVSLSLARLRSGRRDLERLGARKGCGGEGARRREPLLPRNSRSSSSPAPSSRATPAAFESATRLPECSTGSQLSTLDPRPRARDEDDGSLRGSLVLLFVRRLSKTTASLPPSRLRCPFRGSCDADLEFAAAVLAPFPPQPTSALRGIGSLVGACRG